MTITNKETGAKVDAGFVRSPVRLGRNHLNDLAIDEGFVSQWHGLLRFDEETTTYLDLGSTNGTKVDGERLEKQAEIDVTPELRLAIGPLRLQCVRVALRDDQIVSRRASAFKLGGTSRASKGVGDEGTVKLAESADGLDGATALGATSADGTAVLRAKEVAFRQKALLDELTPLYAELEAAQKKMQAALEKGLAEDGTAHEKEARAALLRTKFPAAFGGAATAAGGPAVVGGGEDVPEWLERLASGSSKGWPNTRRALERAGMVLETFATSLVDLDAGQKQVLTDLGIERGAEMNSLPTFTEAGELLGYLLDAEADGRLRADQLAGAFADLALHQLGVVGGAQAGARALLGALSPHAIGAAARGALVKTSASLGDLIFPWGAASNYYKYVSKHLELNTGNTADTHLFGQTFARAYYRVTGRKR